MSRINTNVTALMSTRILNENTSSLNKSLERLSTGLRINRGSDDPAGLIASENLRKQIAGTETAIKNGNRAINIVGTAEGGLGEISGMLVELQSLLGEAANKGGMSTEEIDANQLQVDSILNSIDRISNSTEFEGIKLLNGNMAYTTTGENSAQAAEVTVNAAKLIDGATMAVSVDQTASAQTGIAYLSGTAVSTTALSIQIGSSRGNTELTFAAGTTQANIATAVNNVKEVTGVSGTVSGGVIRLNSVDFGTDSYVSVEVLSGQQDAAGATGILVNTDAAATDSASVKDYGVDIAATVNGASATGSGKKLTIRTAMLDAEIDLTAVQAQSTSATTFSITGGGADFALGSVVDAIGLESIGLQNVATTALGNATDGYLNTLKSGGSQQLSGNNLYTAQNIVSDAIKDVSSMRGRLGSFQKNTLEKSISTLQVTKENLFAAESAIRDTDFASETSRLTRSQILVQASTNVLAQANRSPQSVLSLLG